MDVEEEIQPREPPTTAEVSDRATDFHGGASRWLFKDGVSHKHCDGKFSRRRNWGNLPKSGRTDVNVYLIHVPIIFRLINPHRNTYVTERNVVHVYSRGNKRPCHYGTIFHGKIPHCSQSQFSLNPWGIMFPKVWFVKRLFHPAYVGNSRVELSHRAKKMFVRSSAAGFSLPKKISLVNRIEFSHITSKCDFLW